MFNVCFIEGCKGVSRLFLETGQKDEAEYFESVASKSQSALITKCWDMDDQIFYSLYSKNEKKIKVKTIAMVEKEGFREYYNPETGKGYRRENFGWFTLVLDLL